MPNAQNAKGLSLHNILLIGQPGCGKTTQFRTLPPPGFLYIFDPNCLASIEGADIDYEIFSPDLLDINVHPLSTGKKSDTIIKAVEPVTYTRWEEDIDNKIQTNAFAQYNWIGIDSFTTFADCVMDRVQWLNGRLGKQPEQADWSAQMFTIQNVFRSLSAMNKLFVATAHDETKEDAATQRIIYQPVMTGRLRIRIPLLFSNIWRLEVETSKEGATFLLHLVGDSRHQYVRTSKSVREALGGNDMPIELDVTIPDFNRAAEYGLGSLLRKAGMLPEVAAMPPPKQPSKRRK